MRLFSPALQTLMTLATSDPTDKTFQIGFVFTCTFVGHIFCWLVYGSNLITQLRDLRHTIRTFAFTRCGTRFDMCNCGGKGLQELIYIRLACRAVVSVAVSCDAFDGPNRTSYICSDGQEIV